MQFVPAEYSTAEELILQHCSQPAPRGSTAAAAASVKSSALQTSYHDASLATLCDALSAIGTFHRRLHSYTASVTGPAKQRLQARFTNTAVQAVRSKLMFASAEQHLLPGALSSWPEHLKTAVLAEAWALASAAGEQLAQQQGVCLTHGDSWMRSFMLGAEHGRAHARCPPGFAIDWEFAHWGQPLQDWAHVYAHVWMLTHGAAPVDSDAPWAIQHMLGGGTASGLWSAYRGAYCTKGGEGGGRLSTSLSTDMDHLKHSSPAAAATAAPGCGEGLLPAQLATAWVACELLTRAGGTFGAGYVYRPAAPTEECSTRALEACDCAVALLCSAVQGGSASKWVHGTQGLTASCRTALQQLEYADAVYKQLDGVFSVVDG